MSKDELWDSVKKAAKPSLDRLDKLDKHYIFYLEEMVTPKLLTIFYWILLFAFITKGIRVNDNHFLGFCVNNI